MGKEVGRRLLETSILEPKSVDFAQGDCKNRKTKKNERKRTETNGNERIANGLPTSQGCGGREGRGDGELFLVPTAL